MLGYLESEKERRQHEDRRPGDERTDFEIDRSRIIHCTAFRRLQGKTQVFGMGGAMGGSDFFRTRLTHSLEAAQIGKGIALRCGADPDLVEAACLAHDIGHPPFGHSGEHALMKIMIDHGGFEGNAQNLRILTHLEVKRPGTEGLNLTRATIDALLKYKRSLDEEKKKALQEMKFYYNEDAPLVNWACDGGSNEQNSLECQIMTWTDDIAYSTHDLEDGIKSRMISADSINANLEQTVRKKVEKDYGWDEDDWKEVKSIIETAANKYDTDKERKAHRKEVTSNTINKFIQATKTEKRGGSFTAKRYEYKLSIDPHTERQCEMLKYVVREIIINDERLATLQKKAHNIVETLFTDFDPTDNFTYYMLPDDFRERWNAAAGDVERRYRVVCDYIAGMTDMYALKVYGRLHGEEVVPIFEIL